MVNRQKSQIESTSLVILREDSEKEEEGEKEIEEEDEGKRPESISC